MKVFKFVIIWVIGSFTLSQVCAAQEVSYLKHIKPLLEAKCYACHGVLKQEGKLRLETKSLILKGGDSGAAMVPGNSSNSLILERITEEPDSRMPPEGEGTQLKTEEIALIRKWIEQGAAAPDESIPLSPTEHWAFLPIASPSAESKSSIDAILRKKQNELGLKTQPKAQRSILIRRLYLDLIGLPPTLEQLHDQRPWEEIVDELLASPHYGERWGRHWMDIWRYSDWYGLGAQLRNSQKHIWHWRDWIVNSLNEDKGYDRMVLEMLAGDELAPEDSEVLAGTGFLARNYYLFNRTTWLDSTIEHTGKAFLGLTLNCAKCHDHKYDPISQVDYYNLRAIFEPHQVRLDPIPGVTDFEQDGLPRVFDDHTDAKTQLHIKGNPKNPDEATEIVPHIPEIFAEQQPEIKQVSLPASAFAPAVRDYVRQDHLQKVAAAIAAAKLKVTASEKKLAIWLKELPDKTSTETQPDFTFKDDFDSPNPDAWKIVGDSWKYSDGVLQRTTSTRNPEQIRFKPSLPDDFEITCRYTTTGGATYKSVTFRFDESEDKSYDNFVYTSAHEPGPKVQAAYTRNGSANYPPAGRVAKPIKVGQVYELRFAVRDRLLNVWLDREFILAYQLPDRQPQGSLSLSGFDATVAFDSISIRSLPIDFEMTEAKGDTAAPQNPELELKIAQAVLTKVQAKRESLLATFAADSSTYLKENSENRDELSKLAAVAQVKFTQAEAKQELLAAGADEKKINAAKKKAGDTEKKLAAIEKGEQSYMSFRASRKALETPAHKEPDYPPTYSPTSTGRRLSLARWVASRQNPLTARVAVNHIWMRHFGVPIVESVADFGLRAEKPVHVDVLDHLAWEFMESGWSMKHLHRLIVTSDVYQLSSSIKNANPKTLEADSTNQYYWRMNTRRMEAQIVRDSLLKLSGTLDETLGGPSLDVGNNSSRRSLYFKHSRDQQDKFLSMFDDADLLQCYQRNESIVPQQALALANSELSMSLAEIIAVKIQDSISGGDQNLFILTTFETLLGRSATEDEIEACTAYFEHIEELIKTEKKLSVNELDATVRARLVHSLLNHNDFISIR